MKHQTPTEHQIGIAVDLGSTTVGVYCVDMTTKEEILSFSFANPQYIYGTDIITRINHCISDVHKIEQLRNLVLDELHNQLKSVLFDAYSRISTIVYSGNTTMLHILRGLDLSGMAKAPFTPVDISYYEEKDSKDFSISYQYLPGISAFVGADILAGVTYLDIGNKEEYDLLIDLGTNGEILLLNNQRGYATSTACGPVFDYGVKGAVYGSDTIHAIAACLKRGLIDSNGTIQAPFFEKGIQMDKDFVIKQDHVRNFQLAKGAIYAGIHTLIAEANISFDQIQRVYVSGGLGFYMQIRDAMTVKLLPKEFENKIIISGNTSLEGAKQFILSENKQTILETANQIICRTNVIELANSETFKSFYISAMNF